MDHTDMVAGMAERMTRRVWIVALVEAVAVAALSVVLFAKRK